MVKGANNKRKSETISIKDAFNDLLNEYHIDHKFKEKNLISSWSKLMGKPIAVRTEKLYINNRKLYVHLNSAPLRSELDHSKKKVLEILNREFSESVIDDVVFL